MFSSNTLLTVGLVSLLATITDAAPVTKALTVRDNAPKRGVAYNDPALTTLFGDKASWCYNWGSWKDVPAGSNLEFVPMLHGSGSEFTNVWNTNVENAISSGSKHILSFNEPDQCGGGGACMQDVGATVAAHQQWVQPVADRHPDVKIGAPAVTNGVKDTNGNDMGLPYLKRFLQGCSNCRIDFIVIHWYDSANNIAYFKKHVQDAYEAGGNRPLWITEFAPFGDDAQKQAFLAEALPFLDGLDYVHRYAYHFAAPNVLVNAAGNALSALGSTYTST